MKAERVHAGMTQAELAKRIEDEFEIKLDTSGITRIEAGQREPRLSEALAIAEILGLELADATPSESPIEPLLRALTDQLYASREHLLTVLETVDELTTVARREIADPKSLPKLITEELEGLSSQAGALPADADDQPPRGANKARDRSDYQLKRRILRTLTDAVLAGPEESPSPEREARWNEVFDQLRAYVEAHGHASVPRLFVEEDGLALGQWVASQRNGYVHGLLRPEAIQRLESLPGWTWSRGPRHRETLR
jgi:transcriptional regulator with XRE-family HTH domain